MSNAAFISSPAVEAPIEQAPVAAKRGRPAKYASAAERQAAWRAANAVKTLRLDGKVAPTIKALASQFELDQTHVVNNLLRFALANRNWKAMGIGGWAMKDARFSAGKRPPVERGDSLDSFSLI